MAIEQRSVGGRLEGVVASKRTSREKVTILNIVRKTKVARKMENTQVTKVVRRYY